MPESMPVDFALPVVVKKLSAVTAKIPQKRLANTKLSVHGNLSRITTLLTGKVKRLANFL